MRRDEIARDAALQTGVPVGVAEQVLGAFVRNIRDGLLAGVPITINGLGVFRVKRGKRCLNLPQLRHLSGGTQNRITFAPSRELKHRLKPRKLPFALL